MIATLGTCPPLGIFVTLSGGSLMPVEKLYNRGVLQVLVVVAKETGSFPRVGIARCLKCRATKFIFRGKISLHIPSTSDKIQLILTTSRHILR